MMIDLVKRLLPIILAVLVLFSHVTTEKVFADQFTKCSDIGVSATSGIGETVLVPLGASSHAISVNTSSLPDDEYRVAIHSYIAADAAISPVSEFQTNYQAVARPSMTFEVTGEAVKGAGILQSDPHQVYLQGASQGTVCDLGRYHVELSFPTCTERVTVYQERDADGDGTVDKCYSTNNGCMVVGIPVTYQLKGVTDGSTNPWSGSMNFNAGVGGSVGTSMTNGQATATITFNDTFNSSVVPEERTFGSNFRGACTAEPFRVLLHCEPQSCNKTSQNQVSNGEGGTFKLCDQILDPSLQAQCQTCAGAKGQDGVWTAVGCISREPKDIASRLIQVGLGMGGGVALIMTLAGGFILSTSQGDPQKANQAKEMITNSVIGLLFVIFSVIILQFIGVTILQIPGFGANPGS